MGDGGFGELIRRKLPGRKIIIPPKRSPLKMDVKSKPARLPTPSPDFRQRADEMKRRVISRDPSLARPPSGPPKRTPLKIGIKERTPERTPLQISTKPRSQFEWLRRNKSG